MQKIGLFGGTFNPIHEGHLRLAAACFAELALDKVLFIPDCEPPHKEIRDLADGLDRYNMCRIAAAHMPFADVSDFEIRRQAKSYTLHTARHFKNEYPDAELFLLMGGDMFLTVDRWYEAQELLKLVTVCAGARSRDEYESLVRFADALAVKGAKVRVLNLEPFEASSTDIRGLVMRNDGTPVGGLPECVRRYIDIVRPYGGETQEIAGFKKLLSQKLSQNRFYHSVCVAKEAVTLSIIWEADASKAYTAGLLHDITKDIADNEQLQMLKKFDIILDSTEEKAKKLWHAILGARYVQEEIGINDAEIINAIRYHTTAREGITLLEKIIYLADCISFDRDYDDAAAIRDKIKQSLDRALRCALALTIEGLAKKESPIHIDTVKAYNSFLPAAD